MVWFGRVLKDHLVPTPLQWAGTPYYGEVFGFFKSCQKKQNIFHVGLPCPQSQL